MLIELQGLDFPRSEVMAYFQYANKLPRGAPPGSDVASVRPVVEALCNSNRNDASDGSGGSTWEAVLQAADLAALTLVQLMLAEIWRWRRRGGGMEDEDGLRPAAMALAAIQAAAPEDMERITSSLLDGLDLSEAQKRDLSGGMQQAAVVGFQGAVWGSMAAAGLLLVAFNFLRQ